MLSITLQTGPQVIFSTRQVRLLEAILATGSINAAASQVGLGYRQAWCLVHALEAQAGTQLLETHMGGVGGGGSRLTPAAHAYLQRAEHFHQQLEQLVHAHHTLLGSTVLPAAKEASSMRRAK